MVAATLNPIQQSTISRPIGFTVAAAVKNKVDDFHFLVWSLSRLLCHFCLRCSRILRRRSATARLLISWVRILPGAWVSVSCECCLLSRRGLCFGLVTRPEKCGVSECDREASIMRKPWPTRGRCAMKEKINR